MEKVWQCSHLYIYKTKSFILLEVKPPGFAVHWWSGDHVWKTLLSLSGQGQPQYLCLICKAAFGLPSSRWMIPLFIKKERKVHFCCLFLIFFIHWASKDMFWNFTFKTKVKATCWYKVKNMLSCLWFGLQEKSTAFVQTLHASRKRPPQYTERATGQPSILAFASVCYASVSGLWYKQR